MSDIGSLVTVFHMGEVLPETRSVVMAKLGKVINHAFGANITEPLVYELINLLGKKYLEIPEVKEFLDYYTKSKDGK